MTGIINNIINGTRKCGRSKISWSDNITTAYGLAFHDPTFYPSTVHAVQNRKQMELMEVTHAVCIVTMAGDMTF